VADFPSVAGQIVSWAEIGISLNIFGGQSFVTSDFSAVNWDESLEPGKVRGTGGRIIGRTVGEYDANGSMSMYYDKAKEFDRALAALKPNQIGLVPFDVAVSWEPLSGDGTVHTCTLVGCRIAGRSVSNANGTDPTVVEYTLSVIRIDPGNGTRLL
jgi:hypothetical protein